MRVPHIDYGMIARAADFYKGRDYLDVAVPWTVPRWVADTTLPAHDEPTHSSIGILVGSAEQSFIKLAHKGLKGQYQATTPCFRDDLEDELHFKYFVKLELFRNVDVTQANLERTIQDAADFMSQFLTVKVVAQGGSYDIVSASSGLELGSYGIRYNSRVSPWIYGTGIAEPRFTQVRRLSWA